MTAATYPRMTFAEAVAEGNLFAVTKPYKRKDRKGRPWAVDFRDPLTNERSKRSFRTQSEAWAFYTRVTDDREGLRTGSLTRRQVMVGAQGLTEVSQAKTDYVEYQRGKGRSRSVVHTAESVLTRLLASTNWQVVKHIAPGPVSLWLENFSPNCQAAYLLVIRAWCNWLVKQDKLPSNPLADMEPPKERERMRKRALTIAEFDALVSCKSIQWYRRLWYWMSGRLGLRHAEILRLHWRHVDFDTCTVSLPSEITKTGRAATLPIPSTLMKVLRESRQHPAAKIIPNKWIMAIWVWREDLARAGIKVETEHGKLVPSSLRRTFCTHLARKGVDLRTAQRLMRHSNVNMTANIYTEVLPSEAADAVEKLA